MKESYRGQCNLHLYLARQYLLQRDGAEPDAWGGHLARAAFESAIAQMRLAYQAHLLDIIEQQPLFKLPRPAEPFCARSFSAETLPPELLELADREAQPGWLQDLLGWPLLQAPSAVALMQDNMIAKSQADGDDALDAAGSLEELEAMVRRHRAVMMEY